MDRRCVNRLRVNKTTNEIVWLAAVFSSASATVRAKRIPKFQKIQCRRLVCGLILAMAQGVWPSLLQAAGPYRWHGAQGELHITDRLNDVPEPYRSRYAEAEAAKPAVKTPKAKRAVAKRAAKKATKRVIPRARPAAPIRDKRADRMAATEIKRVQLQRLVGQAQAKLARVEASLTRLRSNPTLAQIPPRRRQIVELLGEQKAWQAKLAKAQLQLKAMPISRRRRPSRNNPRRGARKGTNKARSYMNDRDSNIEDGESSFPQPSNPVGPQ